jgi:hypothetical protein
MKSKKLPSNRTFGLFFSIFFLIIFVLYYNNKIVSYISFFLSIFFFILGVINAKILFSLNYFWIKFGYFLGRITTPIILFLIFLSCILPISLILKIFNKDILSLKINKNAKSYWINNKKDPLNMDDQF